MRHREALYIMGRLLRLVFPLAGYMALAVACGVLGFACATGIPTIAAVTAWDVVSFGTTAFPGKVCGLLAAMAIARGVLHYAEQRTNHYIAFRLLAHIRSTVFGALRKLAPAKLAGSDRGSIVTVLTADIELLEVFFAHTISPICIAVLMGCLMVGIIGRVHVVLGLVALLAYLAIGMAVPLCFAQLSGSAGSQVREGAASLSGYVLDSLRGLDEVREFGAGQSCIDELDRRSRELSYVQRGLSGVAGTSQAATTALISIFAVLELAVAIVLANSGAIDGHGAVLASVALASSFGPMVALASLGTSLQATLASGARVLAVLDEEPAVAESEEGAQVGSFTGASAEGVAFSYRGPDGVARRVLDDVSVEVPQGKVVGISGRSGSGKTTLLRLFMRFWDVDKGSVTLSGKPIGSIATPSLRAAESLVEQDAFLFHDSIRENLLVAKPDATQEELEEACRAASVHDFITKLPHGYDTMVGELGSTLSSGERQRIALARAFLHGAPFLLLDEPTSSLDALNEGVILRSIVKERGDRTVLLVSHRASTMGIADETYTMERGRVG